MTDVPRIDWTTAQPQGEDGLLVDVDGERDHTWGESFAAMESAARDEGPSRTWRAVTLHARADDTLHAALHVRGVQPHTDPRHLREHLDALIAETNAEAARRRHAHDEALRRAAQEAQERRDAVDRMARELRASAPVPGHTAR